MLEVSSLDTLKYVEEKRHEQRKYRKVIMQYRRPACVMHADRSQAKGAAFFFVVRESAYNPKGSLLRG